MAGTRISLYISEDLNSNLNLLSRRMGISKSILVTKLLSVPVDDLVSMFSSIPEKPTGADVLRFKGKSMDIVNQRVDELREILKEV
jgi:hypothetical protein